jgi:hypothetical protein
MDLRETVCEFMDWIEAAQERVQWRALAGRIMNLRVP